MCDTRPKSQGTSNAVKFTEIAQAVGVETETAHQLDRLNKHLHGRNNQFLGGASAIIAEAHGLA